MSGLRVDQRAREFFNRCAIAAGMNDAEAALECCRDAGEIEQHYALRLKVGDEAPGVRTSGERPPASPSLRRIEARFASRCAKCSGGIAVGASIAYDPTSKRAFHERCSP